MEKSGRWYGVYRDDVPQTDGTFKREQCWKSLGLVKEQSERAARIQFQEDLNRVNAAARKIPPRTGLTLNKFVSEWRANVAVNLKHSTTRAAESHLRAHIIPKLGNLQLIEITTKTAQGFVTYLASGGRSQKTVDNVLLTLSSLLKTARSWGYACGDFRFADLTLPRESVEKEPRCFTDDEVQRIIANAREPLSTIVAVTAVLGLRIGETLALRKSDVDFAKQIIRVKQSIDAATRIGGAVKAKKSKADLPMSTELEARLCAHLKRQDGKAELLFVNQRGRHSRRTNYEKSNCIRCWMYSAFLVGVSMPCVTELPVPCSRTVQLRLSYSGNFVARTRESHWRSTAMLSVMISATLFSVARENW